MQTTGVVWDSKTRTADPALMSQLRTDPSVDPVMSTLASASMPRHVTGPVCPEKTCSVQPLSNDQQRAVQSVEPVMRVSLILVRDEAGLVKDDLDEADL